MFDSFKKLFKQQEDKTSDDSYITIPQSEINEELKSNIIALEKLGEQWSTILQRKYVNEFESHGKKSLRVWICRDIDGDELEGLTSENCMEIEYRSQIAIDYEGPKHDEDFYADTIYLWYYFGGYFKSSGKLYDQSKNELKSDIEEALKALLN